MHSAQAYNECALLIGRDDFYRPAHQLIWDTVAGLVATNTPPHPVLIRGEIEKQGQLHRVDGGNLIIRLGADTLPGPMAAHFAEKIAETARQRRYDAHSNALKAAITRKADGDELASLVAEFQQGEQLRENTGRGPAHLVASLLNWDQFFTTDFGAIQLLPGKLMGPGQQITLVGDGKAGKSLFTQEWMWRMATGQGFLGDAPQAPVRILYLDAENGQEQVQERFLSFGAGPRNMGELKYASFPPIRPLDTPGGGADLMALVKATQAELVVIDTVSRFISGPENDADTWLGLYRHTLLPLKRDRIASVRLDHFGKDKDRGGRGSSAKTQDVDHVWELAAQGGGALTLKRTHTRTGIGPDSFSLLRQARRDGDNWALGGTRHVLMTYETESGMAAIPGTAEHIVAQLDKAGVPTDWGSPRVIKKCAELGIKAAKSKIEEAVRIRKNRTPPDLPPHLPYSPVTNNSPETGGPPNKTPGQTSPGEVQGTLPPVPAAPPSPRPPSIEGGGGADIPRDTRDQRAACDVCQRPLNQDWANRGYTTHLGCDPATGSYPTAPNDAA
ncbi:AAA family ATPase [Streptomyces sp. PSKA54]|uniref:AAA family ATPase n=2 Tax=Streptomyces TaxID=1883 RepID=A0A7W2D7H3_9ACTN|nr:AAA family ATPase [Streptomyces himalayensis subsp. aureolus]